MQRLKSFFASISNYLREVISEVKKVIWPGRDRTIKLTGVVVAMVVVIACFLFILDFPLELVMKNIFRRG